ALGGAAGHDIRRDALGRQRLCRRGSDRHRPGAFRDLPEERAEGRVAECPLDGDLAGEDDVLGTGLDHHARRLHGSDRVAHLFDDFQPLARRELDEGIGSRPDDEGSGPAPSPACAIRSPAPRESRASAAALPTAAASEVSPEASSRSDRLPSKEKTPALIRSEPSRTLARAATGALHPASSAERRLLSASIAR